MFLYHFGADPIHPITGTDGATGNTITAETSARLTVDHNRTPRFKNVDPKIGGTMGGTRITIFGELFGSDTSKVTVTIFDVPCDVDSVSDDEIICVTNAFPKGHEQVPVMPVVLIKGGPGVAVPAGDIQPSDVEFWYVDRWSSQEL